MKYNEQLVTFLMFRQTIAVFITFFSLYRAIGFLRFEGRDSHELTVDHPSLTLMFFRLMLIFRMYSSKLFLPKQKHNAAVLCTMYRIRTYVPFRKTKGVIFCL